MNAKHRKAVIRYMLQKEPESDFAKMVNKVGIDMVTELAGKVPGMHIYIPSLQTFNHHLCVLVIQETFKKLDINTPEGKERAKQIAKLFNIKNYQVKKILQVGRFTR